MPSSSTKQEKTKRAPDDDVAKAAPEAKLKAFFSTFKEEWRHQGDEDNDHDADAQEKVVLKPKEEEGALLDELVQKHPELETELEREGLMQCLRSRRYDIPKAAAAAQRYAKWRRVHLGEVDPALVRKIFHAGTFCLPGTCDKEGRAIILVRLRYHDPRAIPAAAMVAALHVLVMDHAYKIPAVQVHGFVMINQLGGSRLRNMDPRVPPRIIRALQGVLPVRLGGIYITNANFVQRCLFRGLKQFLSAKMQKRMHVLSDQRELLHHFNREALPAELGGDLELDHETLAQAMFPEGDEDA